jgi:hypothetical protein
MWLFEMVAVGSPAEYTQWANGYFSVEADEAAVAAILAGRPLTDVLVRAIHEPADFATVAAKAAEMGYPVA